MKLKLVNGLLVVESFENFVPRNANRGKKTGPRTRPTVNFVTEFTINQTVEVEKEKGLEEPVLETREKEGKTKPKEKKHDRDGDGTTSKTTSDSS